MKRGGILHPQLSRVVASLGHTDTVVVADSGLPIPAGVERVDLALVPGVPSFAAVVRALADTLVVQRLVVAEEMAERNPAALEAVRAAFPDVPIERVPHERLKATLPAARAVVRSGEATPYANVVLECGVPF